MVAQPDPTRIDFGGGVKLGPPAVVSEAEHLLKVAASVTKDANDVWAEMWAEFKPHVTPGGVICQTMEKGFVPACGWAEFMEKYWLLKHYLDSIDRICRQKH
jgi:hypothetical protein